MFLIPAIMASALLHDFVDGTMFKSRLSRELLAMTRLAHARCSSDNNIWPCSSHLLVVEHGRFYDGLYFLESKTRELIGRYVGMIELYLRRFLAYPERISKQQLGTRVLTMKVLRHGINPLRWS